MIAGYEPERVAALGSRARVALDALRALTSVDPEADEAMAAVSRLRSTVESGLLQAIDAIEATDPLARGVPPRAPVASGFRGWSLGTFGSRVEAMSDDAILAALVRLELDAPYDDDVQPDMDDPFWLSFGTIARELADRAASDEDFADRLVAASSRSFLVPMTLEFAEFSPSLVGRMLTEVTRMPSAMVDLRSNYQARGAEIMLRFLTRHPGRALRALDATMLKELIEWPTLDAKVVGTFLSAAMQVPFRDRTRLPEAYEILQHLVALSNDRLHETGFPPRVSPDIARIVVQYAPFFVRSLGGYADVHLKDFAFRDVGMRLGTYPEVLDLFGALMRNRSSLDILLASVPGIAVIGAGDRDPLGIGPNDVADYVDTLGKAAENEQLEEQIAAERDRRDVQLATDIAYGALRAASSVMGPLAVAGVEIPLSILEDGTSAVVQWTTSETDLGLVEVRNVAFVLVVFGLGVGVLHSRSVEPTDSADTAADTDANLDDAETIEQAEDLLRRIETRLENGADVEDLAGLIDDFGRLTRSLDSDRVMDILDDARVLPPDIDVSQRTD